MTEQPELSEADKMTQAKITLAKQVHETFRAIRYTLGGVGASQAAIDKLDDADLAVVRELLPEGMAIDGL